MMGRIQRHDYTYGRRIELPITDVDDAAPSVVVVRLTAGHAEGRVRDVDHDLLGSMEREVLRGDVPTDSYNDVDASRVGPNQERHHGPFSGRPIRARSVDRPDDARQGDRRGGNC